MYKHFVRTDKDKNVIHTFSDAFESPLASDIFISENTERHFNLEIMFMSTIPRFIYNENEIKVRSDDELLVLWNKYNEGNQSINNSP